MFSSFSGAIYSPYDNLKISFILSITLIPPLFSIRPTSPVNSQSLWKASFVFYGFLK